MYSQFESGRDNNIVTGLDGLGTTLITWVLSYEVGSIPTVTTNAGVARESYMLYNRSGSWDNIKREFKSHHQYSNNGPLAQLVSAPRS